MDDEDQRMPLNALNMCNNAVVVVAEQQEIRGVHNDGGNATSSNSTNCATSGKRKKIVAPRLKWQLAISFMS